ncbi:MAG: hypothetical protein IPQ19_12625 [Bacteroidetes bacterium]|nr:hypothetical protein [Bacteroidota bacterium]
MKYKASVFQSTGEDWNNIKLTLYGDPLGGDNYLVGIGSMIRGERC